MQKQKKNDSRNCLAVCRILTALKAAASLQKFCAKKSLTISQPLALELLFHALPISVSPPPLSA